MKDQDKTKEQLISELEDFRRRVAALEASETEWRRTEEALQGSEERFRLLVEAIPQPIWRSDPDGNVIEFNHRWYEYTGQTAEEAKESGWTKALHSDEAAMVVGKVRAGITSGTPIEIVNRLRRGSDGSYRWHLARAVPMSDRGGKIVGWFGCATDIDDQKRAEEALRQSEEALQKAHNELERKVQERTAQLQAANEALRESEQRYRTLFDRTPDGIYRTTPEGRYLDVNPALVRMFGYASKEEMLQVNIPRDIYFSPEEREAAPGNEGIIVFRQRRKDGSEIWVEDHPAHVRDARGNVLINEGVLRDITDRKRAEEALVREYRTLKRLLQSSDHERQLIAYEIHDGLAQQLAGAIMQFQTFDALKETKPKQAASAYQAGLTMLQQGHYETRRLIAGVRPPILDEEGVVAALGHLVNEQTRLQGANIEYRSQVRFDRLVPTLENAIYRIAQEALANACKHSKSERVRVSMLQRRRRVRIEVQDWGVGFDPKTTSENRYGLEGIRQRARLLDGKCSIRSKPGKGTRVMVELPVVEREEDV